MNIKQLHLHFLKCTSVSTDTRKVKKNAMFFALKGDNFNGNKFAKEALENGAALAIIDEKEYVQTENTILVDDVLKTLQALATFHRLYLNLPIIALTGSNGKTTTKELIYTVLLKKYKTTATIGNLNNHIGVPLTLLSMTKDTEIGIVEMGANHLKEIEFLSNLTKPNYGYITNFGKAHLEGFGSIQGVIKAKTELYHNLISSEGLIFVNNNDPIQKEKTFGANTYAFDTTNNSNTNIEFISAKPYVKVSFENIEIQSQLIGAYNFNNIAAAICIGHYFNIDANSIKTAIESYTPKNNRSQITQKNTSKIILDAYNANPTSMAAALHNFGELQDDFKIAILGDMFELGVDTDKEHQTICQLAHELNIDRVILIGENFHRTNALEKYKSFETFKTEFQTNEFKNATLLIKGSRGMALERILDLI